MNRAHVCGTYLGGLKGFSCFYFIKCFGSYKYFLLISHFTFYILSSRVFSLPSTFLKRSFLERTLSNPDHSSPRTFSKSSKLFPFLSIFLYSFSLKWATLTFLLLERLWLPLEQPMVFRRMLILPIVTKAISPSKGWSKHSLFFSDGHS